jgi:shikimate kinase
LEKLRELHAQRDPLYAEIAELIVDTGAQSVGNLTSQIQKLLADAAQRAKHAPA